MTRRQWFLKGMKAGIPICMGYFAVSIALGIAASLLFEREGEEKFEPEYILTEFSGFDKESEDYKRIMNYYNKLKNKESLKSIIASIKEETQINSMQA